MNPKQMRVAIIYSAAIPAKGREDEAEAERAVADAAEQAAAALTQKNLRTDLLPVRGSLTGVIDRLRRLKPAVAVNLCEGFNGQPALEAQMAGVLELLDLPFTGNSSAALSLCRDKFRAKLLLRGDVPVPDGWLAHDAGDVPHAAGWPLIVKPSAEDGGIGIYNDSVVSNRKALAARIQQIKARYAAPALVERYIEGREFNVAVIEHKDLQVLPVAEIIFRNLPRSAPRIVGYQAKWQPGHICYRETIPRCPAEIPARLTRELNRAALRAWTLAGLRGYARFDFRMDTRGRIYLLEINPNPDTGRDAGLARALASGGISYRQFWSGQVQTALNRGKGLL